MSVSLHGKVLLGLVLGLLLNACATTRLSRNDPARTDYDIAVQAAARADYETAFTALGKVLRIRPDYEPALALYSRVASEYLRKHEEKAREASSASQWDVAANECLMLKNACDEIQACRLLDKKTGQPLILIPDIERLRSEVLQEAAVESYTSAVDLKIAGKWRDAAISFRRAMDYVPDFEDCAQQYQECRQNAMRTIAIVAGVEESQRNALTATQIADGVYAAVKSGILGKDGDFVEVFGNDDFRQRAAADGAKLTRASSQAEILKVAKRIGGIDAVLLITVSNQETNYPGRERKAVQLSGTVLDGAAIAPVILTPNSSEKLFKQVSGTVTVYENRGSVSMGVLYTLLDVKSSSEVKSGQAKGYAEDVVKWARLTSGNELVASLAKDDLAVLLKAAEAEPADKDELFARASNTAAQEIGSALGVFMLKYLE